MNINYGIKLAKLILCQKVIVYVFEIHYLAKSDLINMQLLLSLFICVCLFID